MITDTERQWHQDNLALRRQAEQEEVARYVTWRERLEKKMRAARKAAPPPPATRGSGWRVLENPQMPHAVLEERVRAVWQFCWHQADFPAGWRARWGELDDTLLGSDDGLGLCAARERGAVLGLCVYDQKIILLDEANQRGRPGRDVVQTIVHELCHVTCRNTVHGEQFQAALRSAMAFYDGSHAFPVVPKGVRFYPRLDPTLEYRG
jgi:hypothetical protein